MGIGPPTTGHRANPNEIPGAETVSNMTTAIVGTGGIGSAIARQLASGGEALQLSSADKESARKLAATIGGTASVAADNRAAVQGADAVVLALRFSVLKYVIEEVRGDALGDAPLVVPSNPVGLDAQGKVVRLLPEGQSSGEVVSLGGCRPGHPLRLRSAPCRPISSSSRAIGRPEHRRFCSMWLGATVGAPRSST